MENSRESEPEYLSLQSDYFLLTGINSTIRTSFISSTSSLLISNSSGLPWQYSHYTYGRVCVKRLLHLLFYFLYLCTATITQILLPPMSIYSKTPFVMHPYFSQGAWLALCLFGFFLSISIFLRNSQVITLLCIDLKFQTIPIYLLLSFYLISRELFTSAYWFLLDTTVLLIILVLALSVYTRIRYLDDGRYQVSWLEYLGIQGNFSVILPWTLIQLISSSLITAYKYDELYDSYILKLTRDDWTIFMLSIIFSLSVVALSIYKDIFLGATLGYCCFGVWYMQESMLEQGNDTYSSSVQLLSFIFGVSIYCFIGVTMAFYCRTACFCIRRPIREREGLR